MEEHDALGDTLLELSGDELLSRFVPEPADKPAEQGILGTFHP
jgi:hypothetical protein